MKQIRARISASVLAAAAAVCALQSVTASGYTASHKNWLTAQTQESTEFPMNFSHSLYYLQRSYNMAGVNTFTDTVTSGLVVGPGYSTTTLSGTYQGAQLTGSVAWARHLANCFYGENTVYMEQLPQTHYSSLSEMQPGDQIVISREGRQYAIFVTGVGEDRIYCSELWGDAIMWSMEFTRTGNTLKRVFGGAEFSINYYLRPVKEGDANGDSIVDIMDVAWLADHEGVTSVPGTDYTTQMMAADMNGNWVIDHADTVDVYYHGGYNRMNGDYRYVTTWHNVD